MLKSYTLANRQFPLTNRLRLNVISPDKRSISVPTCVGLKLPDGEKSFVRVQCARWHIVIQVARASFAGWPESPRVLGSGNLSINRIFDIDVMIRNDQADEKIIRDTNAIYADEKRNRLSCFAKSLLIMLLSSILLYSNYLTLWTYSPRSKVKWATIANNSRSMKAIMLSSDKLPIEAPLEWSKLYHDRADRIVRNRINLFRRRSEKGPTTIFTRSITLKYAGRSRSDLIARLKDYRSEYYPKYIYQKSK